MEPAGTEPSSAPAEDHSGHTSDVIARERDHFDQHRQYLLHFLEVDGDPVGRWLIRQVLRTWDRHMAFVDPAWIEGKRVMEVGCGNPRILFRFRDMGAKEIIGCDLSERFVVRGLTRPYSYVHDHRVEIDPSKARFIYGDANGPATHGIEVDTIATFQSLHHLNLPRFVETCDRMLPSGGHVLISDPMGDHPLRRIGDVVGRRSGLLTSDERARPVQTVIDAFEAAGFTQIFFRSLNPTLEIAFHVTELLTSVSQRWSLYLKIPIAFLRPLENILEATVVRRVPRLGWRYFLVLRKG